MKMLLNNISELNRLISQLKEGESLVIDSSGVISKGTIRGKLTELPVKTVGKKAHSLDGNGIQEMFHTSSWVTAPGKTFKNMWDLMRVKLAKDDFNPMWELFVEKLESLSEKESALIICDITESDSHKFLEVQLPDFPIRVGLNKSLKMRYYIYQGKKFLT